MLKPETKQPDSYLLTGGEIVPDPQAMQYRYKALLTLSLIHISPTTSQGAGV